MRGSSQRPRWHHLILTLLAHKQAAAANSRTAEAASYLPPFATTKPGPAVLLPLQSLASLHSWREQLLPARWYAWGPQALVSRRGAGLGELKSLPKGRCPPSPHPTPMSLCFT